FKADQATARGQEHPVVKLGSDRLGQISECQEVEDVLILVQVVLDLDGRPVVMAMDPFAVIAGKCDEMTRTEDQAILGNTDKVASGLGHDVSLRRAVSQPSDPTGRGKGMMPSRSAAYNVAAMRSAVAPGLRA